MSFRLEDIQRDLRAAKLDGWLFCDFRGRDPLAHRILALPDGMRTHLMMAFEPPLGHPLQFHAAAWQVISRVNAQHTVRRIATSLRKPEIDVARMIGPLVHEGLLVPVGAAGVGVAIGLKGLQSVAGTAPPGKGIDTCSATLVPSPS